MLILEFKSTDEKIKDFKIPVKAFHILRSSKIHPINRDSNNVTFSYNI